MTILPKKKPASAVGGVTDPEDPDSRRNPNADPHQHGNSRSGPRPRASPPPWPYQAAAPPHTSSPPPWPYQAAPHTSRDDRRTEATSRPQQASPQPVTPGSSGSIGGVSGCDGASTSAVGASVSVGGCCSGPGLSKRRRQTVPCPSSSLPGGGGGGPGTDGEEGATTPAGNNSEDEYESGGARQQSEDPASVEQEQWFEKALKKKGFVIKKMQEDGACLFRAVADQVYGDQDMHDVVRKHCMDYLVKNADYFSSYVTEDFSSYINRKRKSNTHGNHIEMQAMAEMYNRAVEVYQYSTEPINTFHGIYQNNDEPIRLSYHGNVHYNSVVNPNKATIGVGLGLPSFKPGQADQSLMKSAIRSSEESWIEQQMLEDKKRATDWDATSEAIEEQVARESYLQWLQDQEKQQRQPRKASAACSSASAASCSAFDDWSSRSPHQRGANTSPEHPGPAHSDAIAKPSSPGTPPSPGAPGTSSQVCVPQERASSSPRVSLYPTHTHNLDYRTLMHMSPTAFGWEEDDILASVLAVSQQEYMDSMKKNASLHREPSPDPS
ncbi:OTU domain-containing protein 5-A-like [Engraulis encrasicolus]|uniref:OTU domain-containing protein 5-A-like n=1 Tax=Engraulis encrasicolus TaxID=184585 RepID=UPI002FD4F59E